MITRTLILAALALSLAACGRAGAPYTPSEAARIEAKEQNLPEPARPTPNSQNAEKRFILDGLLE